MKAPPLTNPPARPSIDLVVDGHRADLVEVSGSHATVHCAMSLKPDQRVRVVLRGTSTVLRAHARVTAARFEMPKEGPRYCVELAFEGDTTAIEKLVQEHSS
jgi:hypothetical protein